LNYSLVAVVLTGCHATSCGLVLAIADLRENVRTRAGDAVWVPPSSVDRRSTMSVGAIPTTDRRPTTRPGNLFRSVTQPVVAALRVAAARDGGRTTL